LIAVVAERLLTWPLTTLRPGTPPTI
jgi:hypothetical protein